MNLPSGEWRLKANTRLQGCAWCMHHTSKGGEDGVKQKNVRRIAEKKRTQNTPARRCIGLGRVDTCVPSEGEEGLMRFT